VLIFRKPQFTPPPLLGIVILSMTSQLHITHS
jgi:hypothetical protein